MGDLFHLVPKDTWVEHKAAETPYYPNTYEQVKGCACFDCCWCHTYSAHGLAFTWRELSLPQSLLLFLSTRKLSVQDGFTHLTKDPGFLLGVANNFYRATTPWNWICLRIDPKKLTHEVQTSPRADILAHHVQKRYLLTAVPFLCHASQLLLGVKNGLICRGGNDCHEESCNIAGAWESFPVLQQGARRNDLVTVHAGQVRDSSGSG